MEANAEVANDSLQQIKKILEKLTVKTQFVEEELVVDLKFVNAGAPRMMLIDSGAPKSVVSKMWIEGYLQEMKVSKEEVQRKSCYRRFKMGETVYVSEVEIEFPVILKTDDGDYIKRKLTAYVIEADGFNFLLGKETLKNWRVSMDYEENKLEFKVKKRMRI